MFEIHTCFDAGPYMLHQLGHSRPTHVAEEDASTPVLTKQSGQISVRRLAKYAGVSAEGLRHDRVDSDPAARRLRVRRSKGMRSAPQLRLSVDQGVLW